jgi:hypothetical protein
MEPRAEPAVAVVGHRRQRSADGSADRQLTDRNPIG